MRRHESTATSIRYAQRLREVVRYDTILRRRADVGTLIREAQTQHVGPELSCPLLNNVWLSYGDFAGDPGASAGDAGR